MSKIVIGYKKYVDDFKYIFDQYDFDTYEIAYEQNINSIISETANTKNEYIICTNYDEYKYIVSKNDNNNLICMIDYFKKLDMLFYEQFINTDKKRVIWGGDNLDKLLGLECEIEFVITNNCCDNDMGICCKKKEDIEQWENYFVLINENNTNEVKNFLDKNDLKYKQDYAVAINYLDYKLPSEMMMETVFAHTLRKLPCSFPYITASIGESGDFSLCECPGVLKSGNIYVDSVDNVWNSMVSKIYRLSMLNQTYVFCSARSCRYDLYGARFNIQEEVSEDLDYEIVEQKLPIDYRIAHSRTCNLRCHQCRNDVIVESKEKMQENVMISKEIVKWLPYAKWCTLAGDGEVLVSKAYTTILDEMFNLSQANPNLVWRILSNGNLLNKDMVNKLIYQSNGKIEISVSVDAATPETYLMTRAGGNWEKLIANLAYVGEMVKKKEVKEFTLNYVIQQCNVGEISRYVRLARWLNATIVHFTTIYNVGTYSDEEFKSIGVTDDKGAIREEFTKYFRDDILRDKNVYLPFMR